MRLLGFSLGTALKLTLIVMLGIIVMKWVTAKVKVPGLSAAVQAV